MPLSAPILAFKRKFPRRRFDRPISFLFGGEFHVGVGVEIGEGGIAIRMPVDFALNREGVVSFQLPEGSFVCVRIELRNSEMDLNSGEIIYGCTFLNLKFEHKREVRAYVSARSEFE